MSVLAYQPEMLPVTWEDSPSRRDGLLANHGEVFTKAWVVEFILDLADYTPAHDLAQMRALEPACGRGAFLVPMVRRLSESCRKFGRPLAGAADAILAVDLQPENVDAARLAVAGVLVEHGCERALATELAGAWVHERDLVLTPGLASTADFVLGNPPYVRLEEMSPYKRDAYLRACPTMGGRADLFIAFYESGLRALKPGGVLAYICADRWTHNQYGRRLRAFIGEHFAVEANIVMHDVDAFEADVSAYPAVTVIRRASQGQVLTADTTAGFDGREARRLVQWARGERSAPVRTATFEATTVPGWHKGADPWPAGSPEQLALVAELEARFPPLEDSATGTRVGIGVATGADSVFVTTDASLVEEDCLLPLGLVRDTKGGRFEWSGHYLIDPWSAEQGARSLVDLRERPRLRAYFEAHEAALRRRHVAGRRPVDWYRTIDRVDHSLTDRPKLLFPDMKMTMAPVFEAGGHYPHHNLYFVVSEQWPPEVLGGLLLSRIAELFVRTYAVKMRGGTLRFQAQYMRRIRIPMLADVGGADAGALAEAFEARDVERATGVAARLYGFEGGFPDVGRPSRI